MHSERAELRTGQRFCAGWIGGPGSPPGPTTHSPMGVALLASLKESKSGAGRVVVYGYRVVLSRRLVSGRRFVRGSLRPGVCRGIF